MDNEKKFRTKTGFCHVLPDKIVLTRDGTIGNLSTIVVGNNISRILMIYAGLAAVLFYFAYGSYRSGNIAGAILPGILGVYLLYGIISSSNNSTAPIIDRQKIKGIKFKKAIAGLTRSRFEILFEDDLGKIKKRLIMLPGSLADGQNETTQAIKIMTDEKLIPDR